MMRRDPKTNPAPGDVLALRSIIMLTVVEVVRTDGAKPLVLYVDRHGQSRTTTHEEWRDWAANDDVRVVEVGE